MRGFHKGVWYAEVNESTRHVGIETISVHEFETEKERDKFVNDYNQVLFTHGNQTPRVYRMATEPNIYVIREYVVRGKYK